MAALLQRPPRAHDPQRHGLMLRVEHDLVVCPLRVRAKVGDDVCPAATEGGTDREGAKGHDVARELDPLLDLLFGRRCVVKYLDEGQYLGVVGFWVLGAERVNKHVRLVIESVCGKM